MATNKQLNIVIEAQDRTSAVLARLEASMAGLASNVAKLGQMFNQSGAAQVAYATATMRVETANVLLERSMVANRTAATNLEAAQVRLAAAQVRAAAGANQHSSASYSNGAAIASLNNHFSNLIRNLLATAAAYASLRTIESVVSDTQKYAEEVRRVSAELGLTTEQASGFIAVTRQMHIDTSALSTAVGRLVRDLAGEELQLDGTTSSSKQALEELKRLGVETYNASTGKILPSSQILANLEQQLSKLSDPERARAIEVIFSRTGGGANFAAGALSRFFALGIGGYNELVAVAEKAGIILSSSQVDAAFKASQAYEQLNQSILGIKIAIVQDLLPYFMQLSAWLQSHQSDIQQFFRDATAAVIEFASVFATGLSGAKEAISSLNDALSGVDPSVRNLIVAFAALELAMVFLSPGAAVLIGLGAIILAIGVLNTDSAKLSTPLLEVKEIVLKIAIAFDDLKRAAADAWDEAKNFLNLGGILPGIKDFFAGGAKAFGINPSNESSGGIQKFVLDFANSVGQGIIPSGARPLTDRERQLEEVQRELALREKGGNPFTGLSLTDLSKFISNQSAVIAATGPGGGNVFNPDKPDKLENILKEVEDAFTKAVSSMTSAISGLFSRPTQERAQINLQTAELQEKFDRMSIHMQPAIDGLSDLKYGLERSKTGLDDWGDRISRAKEAISDAIDSLSERITNQKASYDAALATFNAQESALGTKGGTHGTRPVDTVAPLEAQKKALEQQAKALDKEERNRQEQLKAIDRQIKAADLQTGAINHQIEVAERGLKREQGKSKLDDDRQKVLEATLIALDHTLPTIKEQEAQAAIYKKEIPLFSSNLQKAADALGISLIPGVEQFKRDATAVDTAFNNGASAVDGFTKAAWAAADNLRLLADPNANPIGAGVKARAAGSAAGSLKSTFVDPFGLISGHP